MRVNPQHFILVSVVTFSSLVVSDPLDTPAVDSSGVTWNTHRSDDGHFQQLTFRATRGQRFVIQRSSDLVTWTDVNTFWGFGQDISYNYHQFDLSGGGGGAVPPANPDLKVAMLHISKVTAGGILLTWSSLDEGVSENVNHYLPSAQLVEEWPLLSSGTYGNYNITQFLTSHDLHDLPDPSTLGVEDTALITQFTSSLADMNAAAVAASSQTSSTVNQPLPEGSRYFYRIRREFNLDTDGDGLTNEQEINDFGSNWLAADSDYDGINDYQEMEAGTNPNGHADITDSDSDGLMDHEDAVPGDAVINWRKTPLPKYAVIETGIPVNGSQSMEPLQINGSGQILFRTPVDGSFSIWNTSDGLVNAPLEEVSGGFTYALSGGSSHLGDEMNLLAWGYASDNEGTPFANGFSWRPGTTATPLGGDGTMHSVDGGYIPSHGGNYALESTFVGEKLFHLANGSWSQVRTWDASAAESAAGVNHYGDVVILQKSSFTVTGIDKKGQTGWQTLSIANGLGAPALGRVSGTSGGSVVDPVVGVDGSDVWVEQANGSMQKSTQTQLAGGLVDISGEGMMLTAAALGFNPSVSIWKNGQYHALNNLVHGDWSEVKGHRMSYNGLIVAEAVNDGETEAKYVLLIPVELLTDLNNDGKINAADNQLRGAALKDGVSEEDKDKGTEFLFVNDKLSNGFGDVQDKRAPAGTTDDDDIQEINVTVGIKSGTVRFDHPAIAKLKFFEDKPCSKEVTFPFDLKAKALPETLYIRTDGEFDGQEEGDLVLKYKAKVDGEEIDTVKIKFTVVHRIGDKKYFHATRDYMQEFNSKLCIRREKTDKGGGRFGYWRLVSMLHEKTRMITVDSYYRNPKLKGIGAIAGGFGGYDVAVNGNFCYSTNIGGRPGPGGMTNRCHGLFVSGGAQKIIGVANNGNDYSGPNAEYIGYEPTRGIDIQTGHVPTTPIIHDEALGGFSSKLDTKNSAWHPWYGIGKANNKKVFFIATPYWVATPGGGGNADLKQRLKDSGVPALPGGQGGEIQCVSGDGGSSLALAYRLEGEALKVRTAGSKHIKKISVRGNYYINTYLLFSTQKTR